VLVIIFGGLFVVVTVGLGTWLMLQLGPYYVHKPPSRFESIEMSARFGLGVLLVLGYFWWCRRRSRKPNAIEILSAFLLGPIAAILVLAPILAVVVIVFSNPRPEIVFLSLSGFALLILAAAIPTLGITDGWKR